MPKPQKLHPRGRAPATIHKADGSGGTGDSVESDEITRNFELELCWCIQQLEKALSEKKLTEKQLQESWKVLTVLKNNNQPLIRKRQLMRTHFGDYRAKMAQEEKKLVKMANALKITDSPANPKAKFIRRSAFLTTGDNSFRFNFQLTQEQARETASDQQCPVSASETNSGSIANSSVNSKPFKFTFSDAPFAFNFENA